MGHDRHSGRETGKYQRENGTPDRAIALFHAGRFQAAKEVFAELAGARNRDLAHSAELRIRICE